MWSYRHCVTAKPSRTVAQKMGIKRGSRAHFAGASADAREAINPPELEIVDDLAGDFDYLHLFVTRQDDLERGFPMLRDHLRPGGMLWVSWPKGRRGGTDLTLPIVIKIGYSHGLVESTCLSVNETWSGLKFTHPKPGKTYHNSHGVLRGQD